VLLKGREFAISRIVIIGIPLNCASATHRIEAPKQSQQALQASLLKRFIIRF
jgi:hypothetical protein